MKSGNIILLVLSLSILAGLGWIFLGGDNEDNSHNWQRTLDLNGKEPYDLSVFYETIKNTWGNEYHEIPEKSALEKFQSDLKTAPTGVYFFTGRNIYLTENEIDFLEQFVNGGGTVFISANGIPTKLFRFFPGLRNYVMESYYSDSAKAYFRNDFLQKKEFTFVNYFRNKPTQTVWSSFAFMERNSANSEDEDNDYVNINNVVNISNLDTNNQNISDFICLYHGEGKIMLHANPVFFSNLYLQKPEGRKYVSQVFKHLPKADLWFDLSGAVRKPESTTGSTNRSIYAFIREQKALKYAWWILVAGMTCFLLLGGRRKQRPIPVLRKPENKTLPLIESIGHFYLMEKSNLAVFKREWQQFLGFARTHLRLQITNLDEETAILLSERSGVSLSTVNNIFSAYSKFKIFSELTSDELIEISGYINQFYQEYKNKYGKQSSRTRVTESAPVES